MVWNEKSVVIWIIFFPLNCFSLVTFKIFFFVFWFWNFNYDVVWCEFLWVYPVWGSLSFLGIFIYVFRKFRKFQSLFLQVFFSISTLSLLSFWSWMISMLELLLLCHRSLRLCSFFFFFRLFSLIRLGEFYCSIYKFTESFLHHIHSNIELLWWVF